MFISSFKCWISCQLIELDGDSLLNLGLLVARVSWATVNIPRKVSLLTLPPEVMEEYAKDCVLTCYTCSSRHDTCLHRKMSFDLINRTSDDNQLSGHTELPGLWNRLVFSISSGQPCIEECVSCKESIKMVNKNPSSFFSKRNVPGLVSSERCSDLSSRESGKLGCPMRHHVTRPSRESGKLGGICVSYEASHDPTINTTSTFSGSRTSCEGLPRPLLSPMGIAFVLSTSGTTGKPVLVRVPHCSIVPNILDLRSKFNISPDDVVFNASPLTFDPSVVEVHI